MIKCLLFDCDGTLVDSEHLCSEGLVQSLASYGVELDALVLAKKYRGWKLATILESLQYDYKLDLADDFIPIYRQIVSVLFDEQLEAVKGVEKALQELPQPKAVVSNGPVMKVQQALRVSGLEHYFNSNIYSAYDLNVWKPDPEIYEISARSMGFKFEDCAVIDDGPVGVEAGMRAGMQTFFYNVYDEECLQGATSFSSMLELPSIIRTK